MTEQARFFEKDIEHKIGYFCAPVIFGIKTANTASVLVAELNRVKEVLQNTKIQHIVLWQRDKECLIMLYREELLNKKLENKENRAFLNRFGYSELSNLECLKNLARRFQSYKHTGISFPHEIGVFLDYPLEDVKNFIIQQGKNALFTGYWKVYGELENAKAIFMMYNYARSLLWEALEKGGSIRNIRI